MIFLSFTWLLAGGVGLIMSYEEKDYFSIKLFGIWGGLCAMYGLSWLIYWIATGNSFL